MNDGDDGVSEMLGYAILVGIVISAIICLTSGAAGAISSAVEEMGFAEAGLAMRSFAAAAVNTAYNNNTCFTATEVQVPAGYELLALDASDDIARISITCGGQELFSAREGCIRLQSPFRSVTFEGGGAFSNDSGYIDIVQEPPISVALSYGASTLYVNLISVSTESTVIRGGAPAILYARADARRSKIVSVSPDANVTISITSREPGGWQRYFEETGFFTAGKGSAITATIGGITDVYIDQTTIQVRPL